jgi:hypothetical protein
VLVCTLPVSVARLGKALGRSLANPEPPVVWSPVDWSFCLYSWGANWPILSHFLGGLVLLSIFLGCQLADSLALRRQTIDDHKLIRPVDACLEAFEDVHDKVASYS